MSRAWILLPATVLLLLSAIWCGANDELTSEEKSEVIEELVLNVAGLLRVSRCGYTVCRDAEQVSPKRGSYDEYVGQEELR